MKLRSIITSLFVLSVLGLAAQVNHYELSFGEFHEIKVVDGINVDYECNPAKAGKVEFEAAHDVASAVIFEPGKGKLAIKLALRDGSYSNLPTIRVYSSYLTKISNEGDSLVRVKSVAPEAKLQIKLIGNGRMAVHGVNTNQTDASIISGHGTITVTGKSDKAKLKVTGAGHIVADEFEVNEASCSITGTGSINCFAVKKLNVSGLGSGKLVYRGTPVIDKSFMSNLKPIPAESAVPAEKAE